MAIVPQARVVQLSLASRSQFVESGQVHRAFRQVREKHEARLFVGEQHRNQVEVHVPLSPAGSCDLRASEGNLRATDLTTSRSSFRVAACCTPAISDASSCPGLALSVETSNSTAAGGIRTAIADAAFRTSLSASDSRRRTSGSPGRCRVGSELRRRSPGHGPAPIG